MAREGQGYPCWRHVIMMMISLFIYFSPSVLKVWELIFYLLRTFCPHLGSFYVVSSFTTFRPNFTSVLLQVILPRPRIGMLSLVTVSPVITASHICCLSHHVFDQVNLWPAWVWFDTTIFWQCSPGTVETQRLYPLRHGLFLFPPRVFLSISCIYLSFSQYFFIILPSMGWIVHQLIY